LNRLLRTTSLAALLLSAGIAVAEKSAAALPEAPVAQDAAAQPPASQQPEPPAQTSASAPSIVASPPTAPIGQLGVHGKFVYYVKSEFSPETFAAPVVTAFYRMAFPVDNCSATKTVNCRYPREWEDGPGAFGRNYGNGLAAAASARTASFITGAILREDPRYFPSENRSFGPRVFHALLFTFIDKGDSGGNRIAVSNFAGAVAGGFTGNAYLPAGYRDGAHAEQRSIVVFAFLGAGNEAAEFRPEIRIVLKKLHVPFVK
jgi:hypothetical protein